MKGFWDCWLIAKNRFWGVLSLGRGNKKKGKKKIGINFVKGKRLMGLLEKEVCWDWVVVI